MNQDDEKLLQDFGEGTPKSQDQWEASRDRYLKNHAERWGVKPDYSMNDAEKQMWEKTLKHEDDTVKQINGRLAQLYSSIGDRYEKTLRLTHEQGKDTMKAVMSGFGFHGQNYCIEGTNIAYVLTQIVKWTLYDDSCDFDLHKGWYLWGDVGRGKTTILKFFHAFTKILGSRQFSMIHAMRIMMDISEKKDMSPLKQYMKGKWAFNDIGTEKDDRLFHNKIDMWDRVLSVRADDDLLTHVTSNVPEHAIEEVYDVRIASRSRQMFNFLEVKGPYDFRADDWKKAVNK